MSLKTRPPTGKIPPPVVLLEGDEGAGKSWAAATLSGSDKVGFTAWLQVGTETTADEYGLVPGARYEIIEHDGTWHSIYGQVTDAKEEAAHALKRGDKPFVLVIDSIGGIWELLSEWAGNRAKKTNSNKAKLAADPNAEIDITANFWNDANARWRKLMTQLLTFPGIVLILARGRETALIENGKPALGKKDYKVEGQKSLTFDVPAWVRMTRDGNPVLVKLRSVKNAVQAGERVRPLPGFTLERFIFEQMGFDPGNTEPRTVEQYAPGSDAPLSERASIIQLAIETSENLEQLRAAWKRIGPAMNGGEISEAEARQLEAEGTAKHETLPAEPVVAS